MQDESDKIVVGCRWVSEPGDCQICNALDGKEYYYHPKDGQASMEEKPKRRPHPNCRCHTEPIYDLDPVMEGRPYEGSKFDEHGQEIPETIEEKRERWKKEYPSFYAASPKLIDEADMEIGLFFYSDGRGLADGPGYGLYCGRKWTDGKKSDGYEGQLEAYDDMDEACKKHDEAYYKCQGAEDRPEREYIANKQLVQDLEEVTISQENKIGPSKNKEEIEYAKDYRSLALFLFKGKVLQYETRNQEKEQRSTTSGD
jgi:hypothetical protein